MTVPAAIKERRATAPGTTGEAARDGRVLIHFPPPPPAYTNRERSALVAVMLGLPRRQCGFVSSIRA